MTSDPRCPQNQLKLLKYIFSGSMMFNGVCQTCKAPHQSVEHPWASRGQHAARAILFTGHCLRLEENQRCDLQRGCGREVRSWRCPRADAGIGELCAEPQHAANTKTHEISGHLGACFFFPLLFCTNHKSALQSGGICTPNSSFSVCFKCHVH